MDQEDVIKQEVEGHRVRCHAASTVPWIVKVREGPIWAINDRLSASPPPNRTSCVPAGSTLIDVAGKNP